MRVAVVGSGTMGAGIAQLAAMNDFDALLFDVDEAALGRARESIDSSLERFAAKGALIGTGVDAVRRRLHFSADLAPAVQAADIVIEAVPEDLTLKRSVLSNIVELAPSTALLGTNTSQLSITALGETLGPAAARLVGTHFFNPPVMMKLVEIVRGEETSDGTMDRACRFAAALGREVVILQKDSPGFVTTRVSAIVRLECLRILEEGVATAEDIDKACRLGLGFPMGPIELGDFNGLDTYLNALESLESSYGERFAPTARLRELVAMGRFGKKTRRGFYDYDEDGQRVPAGGDDVER